MTVGLLIVALVSALLGFGGDAGVSAEIVGKVSFFVFLSLFFLSMLFDSRRSK
jgi:uncharacterized membrane protein YtjA (UPF0391 family)